jgi:2-amino-4-hydroxy-6-hydroxymethyldihydropteridine diphosphokinase
VKAGRRRQKVDGGSAQSAIRIGQPGTDPKSEAVFVALGSNLGDSSAILRAAMDRLQALSSTKVLRSSLWRSSPVDCPPGSPLYVNAVVGLTPLCEETPESLLGKLHAMEREFGRGEKLVLNEPRLLDLDLIAWGSERRDSPVLRLPHPRAHLRRFVLQPLSEIAPALVLPGQTKPVAALLSGLPTDEVVERLVE